MIRLLNGLLLLLDDRLDDWLGNLLNWSRSAGNKIKLVLQSHISFDLISVDRVNDLELQHNRFLAVKSILDRKVLGNLVVASRLNSAR